MRRRQALRLVPVDGGPQPQHLRKTRPGTGREIIASIQIRESLRIPGPGTGPLLLARADGSPQRFYSLSAQIQRERSAYYDILERTQQRSMDVTEWLAWPLGTLHRAVDQALHTLDAVLVKTRCWQRWATMPLNKRQVKLLNRLLDSFEGKLTSSKWAAIAKCSPDTALRDISDLLERGVLRKSDAGARSTSYELNEPQR